MMQDSLETFQSLDPIGYMKRFTNLNVRPDERPLHTTRRTTITTNILPRNTYGSSLLQLGNTQIISSITLQVGQPSPSTPHDGEINVNLIFSPICGKNYSPAGRILNTGADESGSGSEASSSSVSDPQAMESYLKRTICSSSIGFINLRELCIERGKSAWRVQITVTVLNMDGNVIDAALLGCVSALKDLHLPLTKLVPQQVSSSSSNGGKDNSGTSRIVKVLLPDDTTTTTTTTDDDGDGVPTTRRGTKLTLGRIPIPLTIGIFDNKLLVDPTFMEENVCDGMITIVVDAMTLLDDNDDDNGGDGKDTSDTTTTNWNSATVLSIQKTGKPISTERLVACVQLCFGRAQEMKELLCS